MEFTQKIMRIGNLLYFLVHPHENQSKVLGYQGWDEILMITLVSSKKSPTPNISVPSVPKPILLTLVMRTVSVVVIPSFHVPEPVKSLYTVVYKSHGCNQTSTSVTSSLEAVAQYYKNEIFFCISTSLSNNCTCCF